MISDFYPLRSCWCVGDPRELAGPERQLYSYSVPTPIYITNTFLHNEDIISNKTKSLLRTRHEAHW